MLMKLYFSRFKFNLYNLYGDIWKDSKIQYWDRMSRELFSQLALVNFNIEVEVLEFFPDLWVKLT